MIGGAMMPVPIFLGGMLVVAVLMSLPHKQRAARWVFALTLIFFLSVTNSWISRLLIRPFESAYAPFPEYYQSSDLPSNVRSCKAIVVLGSGNGNAGDRCALDELNGTGLSRLCCAVRMARLLPDAQIIISGTTPEDNLPHSKVMRTAAISLGIDSKRIYLIEGVRDTADETKRVAAILHEQRFLLVTSAWHMPRAIGLCRKLGLNAIPVPTDFLNTPPNAKYAFEVNWNSESLNRSTWAFHEALGLLWTHILGSR